MRKKFQLRKRIFVVQSDLGRRAAEWTDMIDSDEKHHVGYCLLLIFSPLLTLLDRKQCVAEAVGQLSVGVKYSCLDRLEEA